MTRTVICAAVFVACAITHAATHDEELRAINQDFAGLECVAYDLRQQCVEYLPGIVNPVNGASEPSKLDLVKSDGEFYVTGFIAVTTDETAVKSATERVQSKFGNGWSLKPLKVESYEYWLMDGDVELMHQSEVNGSLRPMLVNVAVDENVETIKLVIAVCSQAPQRTEGLKIVFKWDALTEQLSRFDGLVDGSISDGELKRFAQLALSEKSAVAIEAAGDTKLSKETLQYIADFMADQLQRRLLIPTRPKLLKTKVAPSDSIAKDKIVEYSYSLSSEANKQTGQETFDLSKKRHIVRRTIVARDFNFR